MRLFICEEKVAAIGFGPPVFPPSVWRGGEGGSQLVVSPKILAEGAKLPLPDDRDRGTFILDMSTRRTAAALPFGLYPPIEPYAQGSLAVSGGHRIYWEECGNPAGEVALVVHGGPGGGSNPTMRRLHDAARYRIILFDQRGCGRSTPHASLEDNTTWDLVADMERLRLHRGVERWHVFGGSWGSTLALAYAECHPSRVVSLILRGIFLVRQKELDWFYRDGASWLYPDAFEAFLAALPPAGRADPVSAYYRLLTSADAAVQAAAAKAWSLWEASTMSLLQDDERLRSFGTDAYATAFARIECHYFVNKGFFEIDGQLLRDLGRIRHIPCLIVHGRYDCVTPLQNAWDLHRAWPESTLRIVPEAGHAMTEPGITHELVRATRQFAVGP
jgi:proline iminopeptidase